MSSSGHLLDRVILVGGSVAGGLMVALAVGILLYRSCRQSASPSSLPILTKIEAGSSMAGSSAPRTTPRAKINDALFHHGQIATTGRVAHAQI